MTTSNDYLNKTLTQTPLFNCFLYGPIFLSILIGVFIYLENKCNINLGFNISTIENLLIQFKLSLLVLGAAIPLTALSASIHRSKQTQTQISQQLSQNIFTNHFKHLEEFKKIFTGDEVASINERWGSLELMHSEFYPNSITGDYQSIINISLVEESLAIFREKYHSGFDTEIVNNLNDLIDLISEELKFKFHINRYIEFFDIHLYELTNKALSFSGNLFSNVIDKRVLDDKLVHSGYIAIFFGAAYQQMKSADQDLSVFKRGVSNYFSRPSPFTEATEHTEPPQFIDLLNEHGLLNLEDELVQGNVINCLKKIS